MSILFSQGGVGAPMATTQFTTVQAPVQTMTYQTQSVVAPQMTTVGGTGFGSMVQMAGAPQTMGFSSMATGAPQMMTVAQQPALMTTGGFGSMSGAPMMN
eukprot:299665_1